MNPRNGKEPNTRIFRQGIPHEEGEEKGLLFQSFQAFLDAQFELLLKGWALNQHHPRQNAGVDPIVSTPLTTIRGGEYFYFPSIPGPQALFERKNQPGRLGGGQVRFATLAPAVSFLAIRLFRTSCLARSASWAAPETGAWSVRATQAAQHAWRVICGGCAWRCLLPSCRLCRSASG